MVWQTGRFYNVLLLNTNRMKMLLPRLIINTQPSSNIILDATQGLDLFAGCNNIMLLSVHRIQNESYYKGDEISTASNKIEYNFIPAK